MNEINYVRVVFVYVCSTDEWCCMLAIILCYLSHFIWYVISVKHVFIIRFERSFCISIAINVYISLIQCLFYIAVNFSSCAPRITVFSPRVGFRDSENSLKSNSWNDSAIGTFTVYYIMIVSVGILILTSDSRNREESERKKHSLQ